MNKTIYIAGPLFSESERNFLEQLVDLLSRGLTKVEGGLKVDKVEDFFLPHRDVGDAGVVRGGNDEVFEKDVRYLDETDIIVAWVDGPDVDSGTAVELGYAYARGKKIFGILTDRRKWSGSDIVGLNNMIWGVCHGKEGIYKIDIEEDKKRLILDLARALKEIKKGQHVQ